MKTCPECKAEYTNDSLTTCPNDGAPLAAAAGKPKAGRAVDGRSVKSSVPQKAKSNLYPVVLAAVVLAVLGGLWWLSQRNSKPGPAKAQANTARANSATTNAAPNPMPPENRPPTMTDVPVGNAQTPGEAYRMLFAAVKSQDPARIKTMLSKGTMGLAEMASGQQKKPVDEVVRNGFTETTFVDDYPQMRDERVKGEFGAIEVWNAGRKQWEDIPFIKEDGVWKAAFGEAFGGKWQTPGKGQAVIEMENANANSPNSMIQLTPNANSNASTNMTGGKRLPRQKVQ